MLNAIISLTLLGTLAGFALGVAARFMRVPGNALAEEIETLLPGSQCGQCGYAGCSAAAAAIAEGNAPVTVCPPGGKPLIDALAEKLGITVSNKDSGNNTLSLARVSEESCTGCTRCFKVCPTDAIVGAPRQIHTVIRDACIGCGKCVSICPTECLQLYPADLTLRTWCWEKPREAA